MLLQTVFITVSE